ncbi:MAG: hypothetical protein IPL65_10810 [Lewinellaceae bacterium]|nr:hypothetical protein [Lewinellaceae bacterium]
MMNYSKLATLALLLALCSSLNAQKFLEPNFTFSHKKSAYITLADGKMIEGEIDDIDRQKGLIDEIKIKDANGKKYKLKPEDVKFMYLPPSGFDKFSGAYDFISDATKVEDTDLDKDIIGKGYTYFEQATVLIKKKETKLLVQLLNPSFSSKIKVYHDPYAKETTSFGVAGVTLAGGDAKSYYVSKAGGTAERLFKKNYTESLGMLYGDCASFQKAVSADTRWTDFEKHVFEYGKTCK